MTVLERLLDELIQNWQTAGIDIRPGVSDDDLHAFEQQFGVKLPLDVRAYLKKVDGMPENTMDEA